MSRCPLVASAPSGCGTTEWRLCSHPSTGSQPARRRPCQDLKEVPLFRPRFAVLAAIAALGPVLAPSAAAAAEVHRLGLALSATPTSVNAGDFNDKIDFYNRTVVTPAPRGYD